MFFYILLDSVGVFILFLVLYYRYYQAWLQNQNYFFCLFTNEHSTQLWKLICSIRRYFTLIVANPHHTQKINKYYSKPMEKRARFSSQTLASCMYICISVCLIDANKLKTFVRERGTCIRQFFKTLWKNYTNI